MFLPGAWDLLLSDPLLLCYSQVWEDPGSLFDEGIDSGTFMIQNHGPDVDVTQSQLTQPHLHLPQIDFGSSQEEPISYSNQATIQVSIIVYRGGRGVFELTIRWSYPSRPASQCYRKLSFHRKVAPSPPKRRHI